MVDRRQLTVNSGRFSVAGWNESSGSAGKCGTSAFPYIMTTGRSPFEHLGHPFGEDSQDRLQRRTRHGQPAADAGSARSTTLRPCMPATGAPPARRPFRPQPSAARPREQRRRSAARLRRAIAAPAAWPRGMLLSAISSMVIRACPTSSSRGCRQKRRPATSWPSSTSGYASSLATIRPAIG